MAQERLSMRKVIEVLRLNATGQNKMEIARALSLSRGAVIRTLNRFQASQIPWPLPSGMTSEALENALYKAPQKVTDYSESPLAAEQFALAHQELTQNKRLTLKRLYEEWKEADRIPLSYSRFCHHYRHYKKSLGRSFTKTYAGGEYSFIDFSGDSIGLTPRGGGEKIKTELFVAMERGMKYLQCVSKVCVVDNMKTAVLLAQRYLLGSLRHQDFYSLASLNQKAHEMLEAFNNKVMRH